MRITWIYRLIICTLIAILCYFLYLLLPFWQKLFKVCWIILLPFLLAGFISYILHPLIVVVQKLKIKKNWAISIVLLILIGVVAWLIYSGIPLAIAQAKSFLSEVTNISGIYKAWFQSIKKVLCYLPSGVTKQIVRLAKNCELKYEKQVYHYGENIVGSVNYIFALTLVPIISFYLLKDYRRLFSFFLNKLSVYNREIVRNFVRDVDKYIGGYIHGQLILCVLVATLSYIVYFFFKLPNALLLSLLMGLMNVIPIMGAVLGAIPALAIALGVSKLTFFQVLISIVIIQAIEGNYLSPLVLGKTLNMHSLTIIFALVVGESLGGVLGLIISVPLFTLAKVIWKYGREFLSYNIKSKK